MKSYLILLFLVLFLWSCDKESTCFDAKLGEETSIKVFETASYCDNDFSITFTAYPSDSRCPSNVTCIWAGYIEVELLLKLNGKEQAVMLSTAPEVTGFQPEVQFGDFTVRLIDLFPYPATNIRIDPNQYRVILLVESISS